uniref:Uncharacterized protein n=1 Tax=Meloidogyne enterolobii TaxID=390850 RepID=A0A6V7VT27_MELEN|nr:unnamed protein product [Meloidogyne enterolobii]
MQIMNCAQIKGRNVRVKYPNMISRNGKAEIELMRRLNKLI